MLKKFLNSQGEPKKGKPRFRKISKRLSGMNPYQNPYLKNSQGVERMDSCRYSNLENFLKDKGKPK